MGRKETKEAPPAETRVSDLAVASYLLARDYDLIGIESAAGRVEFVFANVPKQVLLAFYGGDAVSGTALWRTDGTANGTELVEDIDLKYTLGEAARRRQEILRRLTA